jgi:S-adenosylmethionine hydrolase
VLDAHPSARVHLVASPLLFREPLSPVFHGRDLFGPVAGHLARGLSLEEVGPRVADAVRLAAPPKTRLEDGWQGVVVLVDRFGNLTTNLLESDLEPLAGRGFEGLEVSLGGRALPLVRSYSDVEAGQPCALVGSSGRLEIAVNRGRADRLLAVPPGAAVVVRRTRFGSGRS